jgi:hypothetical protein
VSARVDHLHDDRLYDCYLAERAGDAPDPSLAVHLADCAVCRERYTQFAGLFDAVRQEVDAESDEVFTGDHLRHQHAQIMHRIELVNRSAKVISFPSAGTHPAAGASPSRVAPRWLAASAAAGLFVGVAVGGFFSDPALRSRSVAAITPAQTSAPRTIPQPPPIDTTPVNAANTIDDDAFLMELEFSLQRPHTRELQPFDALTPHVREIGNQLR